MGAGSLVGLWSIPDLSLVTLPFSGNYFSFQRGSDLVYLGQSWSLHGVTWWTDRLGTLGTDLDLMHSTRSDAKLLHD